MNESTNDAVVTRTTNRMPDDISLAELHTLCERACRGCANGIAKSEGEMLMADLTAGDYRACLNTLAYLAPNDNGEMPQMCFALRTLTMAENLQMAECPTSFYVVQGNGDMECTFFAEKRDAELYAAAKNAAVMHRYDECENLCAIKADYAHVVHTLRVEAAAKMEVS